MAQNNSKGTNDDLLSCLASATALATLRSTNLCLQDLHFWSNRWKTISRGTCREDCPLEAMEQGKLIKQGI